MSGAVVVLLALMLSSASAQGGAHHHPHSHAPMSAMMRIASNKVEESCTPDLLRLCSPQPTLGDLLPHPMLRMGTPSRDPLMEFMMNPMAPPPPMLIEDDIGSMIEQMMSQAIQLSQTPEPQGFIRIFLIDNEEEPPVPQEEAPENPEQLLSRPAPEVVFDKMVHTVMDRVANPPIPSQTEELHPALLLQRLIDHGNNMLESDLADEDHLRLARRLSQVSPEDFHRPGPRLALPFGCGGNRCIMRAYEEGVTSPACSDAIRSAEKSRDFAHHALVVHEENEAFLIFAVLYTFLALVTLFVVRKHLKRIGHRMRSHLRLKQRILQAVYSDPALKAKVEDAIGDEIGNVPPLPPHVLARMGGAPLGSPNPFTPGFFIFKMCTLLLFAIILSLIFINPVLAMPVLCVVMLRRFIHLACCPPQPPVAMCSCCCCGLSTEDVTNGNLTDEQACCSCCNGMGVCSPGCESCCGTDPDIACDCCDDDSCDCCNPQPEPECNCCCCSVSPDDVLKGNVTEAQACCTCCNGTGECGSGCLACCGTDPDGACDCCEDGCDCCSDDDKKPVMQPKQTIYEGVPIQIV